jgi:uncharacterized protein YbjT (DUF2867 family)
MGNMFDARDRAAMVARLHTLAPQAARRWGRMSAPQMVWHLSAQLRSLLDELQVKPRGGRMLRSAFVRWLVIDLPLPFPRGRVPTAPEYVAFETGEWDADVAQLEERLERWAGRGMAAGACVHPAFGPLDGRRTGRLVWKHWNHHLAQFGA